MAKKNKKNKTKINKNKIQGGAAAVVVPRAADGEGAGRFWVRPRLAACAGAGRAGS